METYFCRKVHGLLLQQHFRVLFLFSLIALVTTFLKNLKEQFHLASIGGYAS